MFPSRVALGNENCSESLGAGKKAKFFAVIPKSAALQNRSYPCSLSVSLCNSPSLLIPVSLAVYLCHLQTQTAGEWDFSGGSSVQFGFGELPAEFGLLLSGQPLLHCQKPLSPIPSTGLPWQPTDIPESRLGVAKSRALKIRTKYQTAPPKRNGSVYNYFNNRKKMKKLVGRMDFGVRVVADIFWMVLCLYLFWNL